MHHFCGFPDILAVFFGQNKDIDMIPSKFCHPLLSKDERTNKWKISLVNDFQRHKNGSKRLKKEPEMAQHFRLGETS